jgi:glycosyltransferase involved in cell wall biosynthesis
MRLAYVCADRGVPLLGHKGASVHLRSLAAALAARGNDVIVACRTLEGPNPPPAGVTVRVMPASDDQQAAWTREFLREFEVEAVLERYSLSSGGVGEAVRAAGVPYVLEVNAPLVEEAARYRGLEDVPTWRALERTLFGSADAVIAVSGGVKDHVVAAGVSASRVFVVHNGVDVREFQRSAISGTARKGRGEGDVVIGFAGSLKPWHGVDLLLRAFAEVAGRPRLVVVGDGPMRADLEALASSLDVASRVRFTGAVSHALMPDLLATMDIGVAPYIAQTGFYFSPLKVAEYLAAGLPVVASDQGDMREIVGDAGLLLLPGDVGELATALARLRRDPGLRQTLSAAAQRRAVALDWLQVAGRVEAVISSVRAPA